jgi:hypothetical protein
MKDLFISPVTQVMEVEGLTNQLSSPSKTGTPPTTPTDGFAPSRKGMAV